MLTEILAQNADDAFARYALAMEHSKTGDVERALVEFRTLITKHPDYANGYFMAAQALAGAQRTDEARQWLQEGIASAQRTRNGHAEGEMQQMLDELERGY